MSEAYSRVPSLSPVRALAKLAYAVQSGNADAECLRSLFVRPELRPDLPIRAGLIVPAGLRKRRPIQTKFLEALEQGGSPIKSVVAQLEEGDIGHPAALTWLLVHSGPSQAPAVANPERYLIVGRGLSPQRAAELFAHFQFHATEFKVATVADADRRPLYLFDIRGSVGRYSTLAGLLTSDQLADCVVLSSYQEGDSWFFAPAGGFGTQKAPAPDRQALEDFATVYRLESQSDSLARGDDPSGTALMDTNHGTAILAWPGERSTEQERYELLPLAGIPFASDLLLTPGLARNVAFTVSDLTASAPAHEALAQSIREAGGQAYRLGLRPTRDRDLTDMLPERLLEEQVYLQDALADISQDISYFAALHGRRPILLRFTQAQLPAMAETLTSFPVTVLRDERLCYAFQATDRHPEGVHFLLVYPEMAARSELDPLVWRDDGEQPIRFWLDPQWARYYYSAGNRHFVFVPHDHVLFPPVHAWEEGGLDRRMIDAMKIFLQNAQAGALPEIQQPFYVCEAIRDPTTRDETIEIAVLDQARFVPLHTQLGWVNDNLLIQRDVGLERFVQLCASGLLESEIDGGIRTRAMAARAAFTQAAGETETAIVAETTRLFDQVAAEIKRQLEAMQKRVEATRAEISNQTEQIKKVTQDTDSTRLQVEVLMKHLNALVRVHAEMKGIRQEISDLEKTANDELKAATDAIERLDAAVRQTKQDRERISTEVAATIDGVRRTRDELRRKLTEL